jgi:tetratricopeptide (TPR) repeat protein
MRFRSKHSAPRNRTRADHQSSGERRAERGRAECSATCRKNWKKRKAEPNNFAAQMSAGDMYAQIGRYDQAFEFYQKGVALNPESFEANVQLANAYFDNRQFENAEKYYARARKSIRKTSTPAPIWERLSSSGKRRITRAPSPNSKKRSKSIPKHEPTLYNLGVAYSRMSDEENAEKTFAELEQANPTSPLVGRLRQILTTK